MITFYDKFGERGGDYARRHLRHNDYWTKDEQIEGKWFGKMCAEVGVEAGGKVSEKEFKDLSENKHAKTGEQITVKNNTTRIEDVLNHETGLLEEKEVPNRKPFCDGPCSAPKTFSVQGILGKDPRIREMHRAAVFKTAEEIERIAGRQIHNGQEHVERTQKIVAAMYEHDASRCQEVQLHTHIVTFNMTRAENGKRYADRKSVV